MTSPAPIYAGFLGRWILIPETCDYQQGEPPRSGEYRIEQDGQLLRFHMQWTDAEGQEHTASFAGTPDGKPEPFAGGDLADALSVSAVSRRELRTAAYWKGAERMIAQRQLDDTGKAMRVTQLVRFSDGTRLANVSVYRKWEMN